MIHENRLTGEFDLVTGASNSVKRSMLGLAKKIDAVSGEPGDKLYYGYAEKLGNGITAWLQTVLDKYKIVQCFYDEIFADHPQEITDERLKPYYRQSKTFCLEFEPDYPDGFNALFKRLNDRVVFTQNLFDLSGLPWSKDTDKRAHNPEFDNYLRLAKLLQEEMQKDGIRI